MDTGVIFTQDGVPVQGSADYQRVIDSRWRFMEVELDVPFNISLPSLPTSSPNKIEKTIIATHAIGKHPYFEVSYTATPVADIPLEIWADEDVVIIRRRTNASFGQPAQVVTGRLRVYNLPIFEDYVAPKTFVQSGSSPEASAGIEFLEESGGVSLGDVSSTGFSIDTRKKILSVHRHGKVVLDDSLTPPPGVTDAIYHNVGYPPTYLLASTNEQDFVVPTYPETVHYVGPRLDVIQARITADVDYLHFKGIQASFGGTFGYVILKDPVELQQ